MKFDAKTLDKLKNFAVINPSIKFEKGNVLRTISPVKTILAKAPIEIEIEDTFVIGELSRFMSTLSLFKDPEVILADEKYCIIKQSDRKEGVKYHYTAENVVKVPPEKGITFPSADVQFTLKNDRFEEARKVMSVLSLQELSIVGEEGKLKVRAENAMIESSDNFEVEIGDTDKNFKVVFKSENLKCMALDYDVSISSKGISWFKNPEVEYWIAIESAYSKFN